MKFKGIRVFFWVIPALAALTAAVMLLWNFLIPPIFGLATINFWQALGLFILARLLFGGFGHNRMPGHRLHGHKNPIHEKWMQMTPEQRREFINKRRQSGFGHAFDRHPFNMENHGEQFHKHE